MICLCRGEDIKNFRKEEEFNSICYSSEVRILVKCLILLLGIKIVQNNYEKIRAFSEP